MHTSPVAQNTLPPILMTSFNWVGGFHCLSEHKRREGTMVASCHPDKGNRLWLSGPVPSLAGHAQPPGNCLKLRRNGEREAPAHPGAPDFLPPRNSPFATHLSGGRSQQRPPAGKGAPLLAGLRRAMLRASAPSSRESHILTLCPPSEAASGVAET